MATNRTPRQEKVRIPMSKTESGEKKRRRPKNGGGDVFHGAIKGFVNKAYNDGKVVAYDETVFMGNAGDFYEPSHVPNAEDFYDPPQVPTNSKSLYL